MADSRSDHSQPSKLGRQFYWGKFYDQENENFTSSGNEGEVWFDESCEDDVIEFARNCGLLTRSGNRICDLGTGNGHFLFKLAHSDIKFESMIGIDYSSSAVKLASSIQNKHIRENNAVEAICRIKFLTLDFLKDTSTLAGRFNLIFDKGTFDAVSLSDGLIDGRRLDDIYPNAVKSLLDQKVHSGSSINKLNLKCKDHPEIGLIENGCLPVLIITSCNWTRDELISKFELHGWRFVQGLKAPEFTFGGRKGSKTTTLMFTLSHFVQS